MHDALPLLASADLVMLSAVGSRATAGLDKAGLMLERHGVVVQTLRAAGSDEAAGAVLLAQAAAYGADLLVIGSYGRSRMRELLFGGVTRVPAARGNRAGPVRQLITEPCSPSPLLTYLAI